MLRFKDIGKDKTRIFVFYSGWGDGDEWDEVYDYFMDAWDAVLKRL